MPKLVSSLVASTLGIKDESDSDEYSEADNQTNPTKNASSRERLMQRQRERVNEARAFVNNINGKPAGNTINELAEKKMNINRLKVKEREYERRVEEGVAWDRDKMVERVKGLESELRALMKEETALNERYNDSMTFCENFKEKKTVLLNNKKLKDFKVDVNLYGKGVEDGGSKRDGWLEVKEVPKNDKVAKQLHGLEMRLLNKELGKSLVKLEKHAEEEQEVSHKEINIV